MPEENKTEQLYNADGEPVEGAMTKDQVEAKVAEAKELGATSTKEELNTKIGELNDIIKQKDEELEQAGEKDQNFKSLRKQKDDAIKAKEDLEALVDERIKKVTDKLSANQVNDLIEKASRGDEEVKKKIKFHYDSFKGEPETTKDIQERIKNAVILATGARPAGGLGSDATGTGGGSPLGATPTTKKKVSKGALEVGEKMGISEEKLKELKTK